MQYPIFIYKDANSVYGVIVPDLPGCFSAGDTIEEAIENAKEAIECHLEGLLLDKTSIPQIKDINEHLEDPNFKGYVYTYTINIDISKVKPQELL